MKTKKSFEEVETLIQDLRTHIETCMDLYEKLVGYQTNIVQPLLKSPFCLRCGEHIEEQHVDRLWKCTNCRKEEKAIREARARAKIQINLQGD